MKILALVKFLKTENLTDNVLKYCTEQASMPLQPRSHANSHTVYILTSPGRQLSMLHPKYSVLINLDLLFPFLAFTDC